MTGSLTRGTHGLDTVSSRESSSCDEIFVFFKSSSLVAGPSARQCIRRREICALLLLDATAGFGVERDWCRYDDSGGGDVFLYALDFSEVDEVDDAGEEIGVLI